MSLRDIIPLSTITRIASTAFIANLPTVSITDILPEDRDCGICISPYSSPGNLETTPFDNEQADVPVRLPCNHVLGRHCLSLWLSNNTTCPICRHELFRGPLNGLLDPAVVDRMIDDALEAGYIVEYVNSSYVPRGGGRLGGLIDLNHIFGTRAPFFGNRTAPRQGPGLLGRVRSPPRQLRREDVPSALTGPRIRRGELQDLVDVTRIYGLTRRQIELAEQAATEHVATPVAPRQGTAPNEQAQTPAATPAAASTGDIQPPPAGQPTENAGASSTSANPGRRSALVRRTARTTSRAEPYASSGTTSTRKPKSSSRTKDGNNEAASTATERRVTRGVSRGERLL